MGNSDELIINTLMTEYKNIHERVFRQIEQYESTNVQTLMLVGVLLFFGITNYESDVSDITFFVNCVFIIALPVISLCTIILSVTHLVKIMILGDFLKIIENKVNKILGEHASQYQFGGRVLSWEWWRIKAGYARKGPKGVFAVISFDLIIIILILAVTIVAVYTRENYIQESYLLKSANQKWLHLFWNFPFIFIIFSLVILFILSFVYAFKRKKSIKHSEIDDELISFDDKSIKKDLWKENMKSVCMILIIFVSIISLIIFCFGRSRNNYNGRKSPKWMWGWSFAHKGLHGDENTDENSLKAFSNAIQAGYAIELDLRSTKDKVPMVCHDNNLLDEVGENIRLSDITFDQAKQLTYIHSGEHIASLEEVLSFVNGRVPLLIDVKSFIFPGEFENNIVTLLSRYNGQYAIQCFSPIVLNYFRELNPNITIGLLLDDIPGIHIPKAVSKFKDNVFSSMCRPSFITYNANLIEPHELDIYRRDDHILLGYLYTDDDIKTKAFKDRVDGIIFEQ